MARKAAAGLPRAPLIAAGGLALAWLLRRRLLNGLQVLIAKGRPRHLQRRSALKGNYAPISAEVFSPACEVVKGSIPLELDGMFLRNGSNPVHEPYAGYHWFEGDGCVHATRIVDGKASYANHFVRTHRFKEEAAAKFPIYAKFGDQEGVRGVAVALLELAKIKTGVLRGAELTQEGVGTANTSLVYHAGRLLALHEGDLPYQLRAMCEGLVATVGRMRVGDWSVPFTAHPKLDAATGNLHIIGYNIDKQPYLTYGVLSPNGSLTKSFPIAVPFPSMVHDFAITQHYAVFFHMPLVFDPAAMVKHNTLPVIFRPELPSKIGLLPLTATSGDEITWYELPSFYIFHIANAWEEDGKVKVYACEAPRVDLAAMKFNEDMGSRLTEYVIDTAAGTASRRQISQVVGDFPIVHPQRYGQPTRYAYLGMTDTSDASAQMKGICKLDLTAPAGSKEAAVATIEYDGLRGGEAYFVPRHADASKCAAEDDGFLLVYTTAADASGPSFLNIYDAATMDPEPLAQVSLPQRVPHGFHAYWITAQQIREQQLPGLKVQ